MRTKPTHWRLGALLKCERERPRYPRLGAAIKLTQSCDPLAVIEFRGPFSPYPFAATPLPLLAACLPMAPQAQRLSLTTTSLQNVVISNASDVIYYEVVTPKWEPTMTRVSKMDPKSHELEVVAELKNEVEKGGASSAPSAVRLRGQQFRPAGEFWTKDGSASNLGA